MALFFVKCFSLICEAREYCLINENYPSVVLYSCLKLQLRYDELSLLLFIGPVSIRLPQNYLLFMNGVSSELAIYVLFANVYCLVW